MIRNGNVYHVRVERADVHWLLHVLELGKWTQAAHVGEVETRARALIAATEQIPLFAFDVAGEHGEPLDEVLLRILNAPGALDAVLAADRDRILHPPWDTSER